MLDLKISVKSLNAHINDEVFMNSLRKLTLNSYSGMNQELNSITDLKKKGRKVDARAIMAHKGEELVGWALFSREKSDCCWTYKYNAGQGILLQIYTNPTLRKTGIGTRLIKKANKLANGSTLCVVPWNDQSHAFFLRHKNLKLKSVAISEYFKL